MKLTGRKLDPVNILEEAIGGVIATGLVGGGAYLFKVLTEKSALSSWLRPILGGALVIILLVLFRRTFRKLLKSLTGMATRMAHWVRQNWRFTVGFTLLLGVAYGVYTLTNIVL